MASSQPFSRNASSFQQATLPALVAAIASLAAIQQLTAATNVVVWDTLAPFTGTVEGSDSARWKAVPGDLLALEADPPKASSDPGYYGREYTFKGDAVVETRNLAAAFWSSKGRVVLFSKVNAALPGGAHTTGLGRQVLEVFPLQTNAPAMTISHCTIVRNGGDEVALEISFSAKGLPDASAVFTFGKTEPIEVKPAVNLKGLSVRSRIEYAVLPGFIGDDLLFNAAAHPSVNSLFIPAQNVLLGLLQGEQEMLVMTWPKGSQQTRLGLETQNQTKLIGSVDFENDGQNLYLAVLGAPGIWHREELKPSFLEKEEKIGWKKPFAAKWKTQLEEAGVKTSFTFREAKGEIWRGVPGSYKYPAWFDGDATLFHLSKKIPPRGESVIYFLEGQDTPVSVSTPVDILKATLGRQACESILDIAGRKLRTHHRRGEDGVRRACTCGCTEAIQAVFAAGEEVTRRDEIARDLDDMMYFVHQHVDRIDEYRRFADELIQFLAAKGSDPDLKAYVEALDPIARQIPQEYNVQKENMGSQETADKLTRQTLALAAKKDPGNLKAYMDLLKAWRAMGGAQDYVLAQCHTITRKLSQEAGYRCVDQPKAAILAGEIRMRCRQILRNPDGYEIWADY